MNPHYRVVQFELPDNTEPRFQSMGFSGRIWRHRTAPFLAATTLALALAGCAPRGAIEQQQDEPATQAAEATTATAAPTKSADAPATSKTIGYRASPAPPDFKLPFPEALPATDIEPGKRGGTFVYSSFGEGPKTFDPITANESSSVDLIQILFAPLVSYDYSTHRYVPGLLKEWYMEEDPHNWILRLRSGAKWSDGQPITADDVLFTMQVIYDPKIVTPSKDTLQVGGKPIEFEKVDDLTVRARTAEPTGFMDVMMASILPVPRHSLEATYKAGTYESALNISTSPEKIVCSGPFKLKLFQPSERVVLEANPHYFKYDRNGTQLPYLDTVIFSYAPDTDQMLLRFKSGTADALGYPRPESISDLRDGQQAGNYTLYDCGPGESVSYLWFNLKPGNDPNGKTYVDPAKSVVFNDGRFRKAVLHALNKEAIINSILRGFAISVWGEVSPGLKEWHNPAVAKYEYAPDKSRALLDELNMKDSDGDGLREFPGGGKFSFKFITNRGNKTREEVAGLLAADLREVGILAEPDFVDFNALVTRLNDSFQYEACYLTFGGSIHPITSMNSWRSNGRTHFFNPLQKTPATAFEAEIDRLADQFTAALEPAKQREIFFRMQSIWSDNVPALPLFSSKVFFVVRNKFTNVKPSPLIEVFWNIDEFAMRQ